MQRELDAIIDPVIDSSQPLIRGVAAVFVAMTALMMRYDNTMRAAGGPGIIGFELAGSEPRASAILERWGASGIAAARTSLLLDFGYMTNYGILAVLLSRRAQRRRPRPRLDAITTPLCLVAIAADAAEGVSLLQILRGDLNRLQLARRARRCALVKFAALAVVLARCAEAQRHRPDRSRRVEASTFSLAVGRHRSFNLAGPRCAPDQ